MPRMHAVTQARAGPVSDGPAAPASSDENAPNPDTFLIPPDIRESETLEEARTLVKYADRQQLRGENKEDREASEGIGRFNLGEGLRVTWLSEQKADKGLRTIWAAKNMTDGYRIATDGLLEREIKSPPPCVVKWVPVVPDGMTTKHMSWKRWIF